MRVHMEAERTNRSLTQAPEPKKMTGDPALLFWRRLIESAVADAKRTKFGLPTDTAILARYWIAEDRPTQENKDEWERSFECACQWLDLDTNAERQARLKEIDEALAHSYKEYASKVTYVRRAAVLACAGKPTAIARQYIPPTGGRKGLRGGGGHRQRRFVRAVCLAGDPINLFGRPLYDSWDVRG
jgi:hypothetical protein